MTHFTIVENKITAHASRKAARETGEAVFSNEVQFADLIGSDSKRLVEIYNGLTGLTPVTRFKDRRTATERIWKAIQNFDKPATTNEAQEVERQPEPGDEVPVAETPVAAEPEPTPEQPATVAADTQQTPDAATQEAPAKKKAGRVKKAPVAKEASPKTARAGSKRKRSWP